MISRNSPMPAYYQTKMRILDMIKQDDYEIGDKLPMDSDFVKCMVSVGLLYVEL